MSTSHDARYRLGSFAHQLTATKTLDSATGMQLERLLDEHAAEVRDATRAELRDALDDYLGHALDDWLASGAVDPSGHNVLPDGEPAGDCYKCRRIRDFLRAVALGEDNGEAVGGARLLAKAHRALESGG